MNTTFKEIIYNVKNLRQAGRQSQDALLSDAQYAFIIDQYRTNILSQDYNKRKAINPVIEQTLSTKFERVKSMEQDLFNELRVYKALELPRVMNLANRPYYSGVRSSLLSPTITRSTSIRIKHDLQSDITGMEQRYFPLGDELYVVTPDPIEELFVTGVFERPIEVHKLTDKWNPFDPYNFSYPFSLTNLDLLYKMMGESELRYTMLMPNDLEADGKESTGGQPVRTRKQEDEG